MQPASKTVTESSLVLGVGRFPNAKKDWYHVADYLWPPSIHSWPIAGKCPKLFNFIQNILREIPIPFVDAIWAPDKTVTTREKSEVAGLPCSITYSAVSDTHTLLLLCFLSLSHTSAVSRFSDSNSRPAVSDSAVSCFLYRTSIYLPLATNAGRITRTDTAARIM